MITIKYIKASEDYMLYTVTAKAEDSGPYLLATIQDMSAILNHNPTIGDACHLVAAKLELGNRFTGWPAWDYGAELAKCQRYFQRLFLRGAVVDNIIAYGWNVIPNRVRIPLPVTMRVPPVLVSFNGTIYQEKSNENITDAIIYNGSSANEVVLSLGKNCLMVNGEVRLSAEL